MNLFLRRMETYSSIEVSTDQCHVSWTIQDFSGLLLKALRKSPEKQSLIIKGDASINIITHL